MIGSCPTNRCFFNHLNATFFFKNNFFERHKFNFFFILNQKQTTHNLYSMNQKQRKSFILIYYYIDYSLKY